MILGGIANQDIGVTAPRPSWMAVGAIWAADFVNGRYWNGEAEVSAGDCISSPDRITAGSGLGFRSTYTSLRGAFRNHLDTLDWTLYVEVNDLTAAATMEVLYLANTDVGEVYLEAGGGVELYDFHYATNDRLISDFDHPNVGVNRIAYTRTNALNALCMNGNTPVLITDVLEIASNLNSNQCLTGFSSSGPSAGSIRAMALFAAKSADDLVELTDPSTGG